MIQIREALLKDTDSIVNLINTAFAIEAFFVYGNRIDAVEVRDRFQSGKFFLAENEEKPVGCIYLELRGEVGYFGLLSVDPNSQRAGIGRKLISFAEEHFKTAGCKAIELQTVNVRHELPPFYRKLGYIDSGTAPFPLHVKTKMPCHFIVMSKPIAEAR
ncbi:MAG TPA: GNAT family N-acetyltransferase [Blastocatellia bacterium]|nr:GNAT family N-acetyltransferase [Blastocatellia bacterium]